MNELIEQLTQKVGLSPEQAHKALETVANYVKEKFPMLEGAVGQLFSGGKDSNGDGKSGLGGFGNFGL